jgi:hypothetical protein
VIVWDYGLNLAIEYIRGCLVNYRLDRQQYFNCDDDIHIGYVVLQQSNQILLNYLCSPMIKSHLRD